MTDANMNDMISAIVSKDRDAFADAFQNELQYRVADSLIDKELDISSDIIQDTSEEVSSDLDGVTEALVGTRNAMSFKRFAEAVKKMGVQRRYVILTNNNVTVTGVKNPELEEMIMMLAKDMKATIKEGYENIIIAIKDAQELSEGVVYILEDSNNIHIMPENAYNIIQVHDKLNADNQATMRDMLSESEESYYKILEFCGRQENKNNEESHDN